MFRRTNPIIPNKPNAKLLYFSLFFQFIESQKAANKPMVELKKAAASAVAAFTIGSSVLTSPIVADAMESQPFTFTSTNIVAEKVVRQGLYQDYEVDLVQSVDDAKSTFKQAGETKSKKGM